MFKIALSIISYLGSLMATVVFSTAAYGTTFVYLHAGKYLFVALVLTWFLVYPFVVFLYEFRDFDGSVADISWHRIYRASFSIMFVFAIIWLPSAVDIAQPDSSLVEGGFTATTFNEVILLAYILFFLLVSYKRCLMDTYSGGSAFIDSSVRALSNLFTAYAFVLIYPVSEITNVGAFFEVLGGPVEFFSKFNVINIYTVDQSSTYMITVKIIAIVLINYQLHLIKKYYVRQFVSHNYLAMVAILAWTNIFLLGIDNIFMTLFVFDIASICTAAFIVLHEKPKQTDLSSLSMFYLMLSFFTSFVAYAGVYYLYTQYTSLTFTYYFLLFEKGVSSLPNGFIVLAWFFISIKLFFLLGSFPFYKYILDIGVKLFFPSLFYWTVMSKLPVLVFITKYMSIVNYIDAVYFPNMWLLLMSCSILYGSLALYHTPRIKMFIVFSSLINVPTTVLFATMDWKASIFVVLVSFSVYAAAVFGLLLYLSSSYKLSGFRRAYSVEEVETFEDSTWAAQQVSLTRGLSESFFSENVYISIVKLSLGISILVLMGAAPFAGFFLKYLIVSLFSSSAAFLVCAIVLVSAAITNLAYFDLLTHVSEKISGYSDYSYNEWVMLFDEDDLTYFYILIWFSALCIPFLLNMLF